MERRLSVGALPDLRTPDGARRLCSMLKPAIPEDGLLAENDGKGLLFAWTKSQIIECRACGRPSFRQAWTTTPQLEDSWAWSVYANPEYCSPLQQPKTIAIASLSTFHGFGFGHLQRQRPTRGDHLRSNLASRSLGLMGLEINSNSCP
jgi:hypothetical protein